LLSTPCTDHRHRLFASVCRYALLSSPQESCNPTADKVYGAQEGGIIVVAAVSLVILLYCVMNGTTILNIFNPEVSGPLRRMLCFVLFHFLLCTLEASLSFGLSKI